MCRSIAEGGRRCTGGCVTAADFLARQQRIRAYDRERKARVRARKAVEQEVSVSPEVVESPFGTSTVSDYAMTRSDLDSRTVGDKLSYAGVDNVNAVVGGASPRWTKMRSIWGVVARAADVEITDKGKAVVEVHKKDGRITKPKGLEVASRGTVDGVEVVVLKPWQTLINEFECERCGRDDCDCWKRW